MKCKDCKKKIDKPKIYAVVIKDSKEIPYHIECFHKNYIPIEKKLKLKINAAFTIHR